MSVVVPIPPRDLLFHSFVDIGPIADHLLNFDFPFFGSGLSLVIRRSPIQVSSCSNGQIKDDLHESTMFGDTTMSS